MAIRPLGAETALLLRASAVVVTPLSLIKELVDNAIDANASSVKVQMARNGVNQIDVQDNGVGIHQDDFDALGRRAHTSKLRTFQDLPQVGGTSLGFRGEALAAANSFAEVIITTRTAQEKVGHRIYLEPKRGGIKTHDLVPAPVGTTVRVQNLFASIPVRKKITTDNIQKTIADAKQLLQTYALARPSIRLSFGILGDNKLLWSYSPIGVATVREAAFQVLGKDLAAQYTNITVAESAPSPANWLIEELTEHAIPGMTIDAFLPQQDADITKICKKGPFISVDGRPMAPGHGTMKKIVAAFKARFGSFYRHQDMQPSVSNVFIQVDIRCPPGSYDINVSPAKDEVLFTDESHVLKVIDSLLDANYPITMRMELPSGSNDKELDGPLSEDFQFQLLESFAMRNERPVGQTSPLQSSVGNLSVNIERDPGDAIHPTSSSEVEDTVLTPREENVEPDTTWLIDMSNPCDDDSLPQAIAASVIDQLRRAETQRGQKQGNTADADEGLVETNPSLRVTVGEPQQDSTLLPGSTTQAADSPNPWTIAVESAKSRQQICYDPGSIAINSAFDSENEEVDRILPGGPGLVHSRSMFPISPSPDIPRDGAIMRTPPEMMVPQTTGAHQISPSSKGCNSRQTNPLPRLKQPTTSAPQGRQLHASCPQAPPQQGQQHQQQTGFAEFETPLPENDEHQVVNVLYMDSYMRAVNPMAPESTLEPGIPEAFCSSAFPVATDVSARGLLKMNGHPPVASVGINDTSSLGDRNTTTMDVAPADKSPNQHDPRQYLMKRWRSRSMDRRQGGVLRRMQSAFPPLETIPVELEMPTVALVISTSYAYLRSGVFDLVHLDNYVSMGAYQRGLPDDSGGAAAVQTRLQIVCSEWTQRTTGRECDLRLNLWGQMKGKSCR